MDVVKEWTARHACLLQASLRETNEGFAKLLGVGARTVAAWHADPGKLPRSEVQQLLDRAYEDASEAARSRFALMSGAGAAGPQVLRVAIAVVLRGSDVLLVCRRGDDAAGISWQFPAGVVKPGVRPEAATVRETLVETGVHCAVRQHLGERLHPITGVYCEYYLCDYLTGDVVNGDSVENVDAAWVPLAEVTRFIPTSMIYPPILAVLKGAA